MRTFSVSAANQYSLILAAKKTSSLMPSNIILLFFYFNICFRHTYDVESLNALRLSYLPKRTSFRFEAMEAKSLLVLLDHNFHLHRKYKTHANGFPQLHRKFNSKSKKECVRGVKENKSYPYIGPLVALTECFAINGATQQFLNASFDPTTLAPTIRGQSFQSTSSTNLLAQHISRF
jgi:hypothetical protein